jgi:hypothetical protein
MEESDIGLFKVLFQNVSGVVVLLYENIQTWHKHRGALLKPGISWTRSRSDNEHTGRPACKTVPT